MDEIKERWAIEDVAISHRLGRLEIGDVLGVTRNSTGDRNVLFLEYEAYRPMADNQLQRIVDEIKERWAIEDVTISHRLGRLEIGEASLMVAIASPHRKEAFEACAYSPV